MIKVLAIDDEPLALQQLVAYIGKMPFLELRGECMSAMEAREIMDREVIDAIFCDINMPDLNGMDFVRQLAVPPLIVFTTAYSEYAIEGYRVNAVDYLLKPFGLQDFQRAAQKVKERFEQLHPQQASLSSERLTLNSQLSTLNSQQIFIKTDSRTVRVTISDIRYVEAMSEYLKLHLDSQPRPLITLLSMKKMEEFLPPESFMRIHRSYIVNLEKVLEVNKNRVIMGPDEYLPIGENYRDAFQDYIASRTLTK